MSVSRSALCTAAVVVALVALASACGRHDATAERRDAVTAYVRAVNRVESRSLPAFRRADAALRSFGTAGTPAGGEAGRLAAAAAEIESAGAALRRIAPPPEAARIHRDLLDLFAREAALTREVGGMSAFLARARRLLSVTVPLPRGGRLTADDLARYSAQLRRTAAALAAAVSPPALVAWRDDEVEWLRTLRREAGRLATALRVNDANAARVLAVRFRLVAADAPGVTAAQRRALIGYNARAKGVQDLRARIADELAALDKNLR